MTRFTAAVLGLVLAATWAVRADSKGGDAEKKPTPQFPLGKGTTFVTEPLDKDGYIDYPAALNRELSKGITPEKNANVLLWKAFGPHPDRAKMPAEFFQWLGIEPPPERGDYFVDLNEYAKEHLKRPPGEGLPGRPDEQFQAYLDQHERARQRVWTARDYPQVAGWLKINEKPLAVVVEATRRPEYFNPLTPRKKDGGPSGLISALLPGVQKCREFAAALAVRAMLHAGEGRTDAAWQDLLACHRLGRLVGRGATLVEWLVGIAIDAIASNADIAFLDRVRLDSNQTQACLRDLQQLPPLPAVADKIQLGERFMLLDCINLIHRYGFDSLLKGDLPPSKTPPDPQKLQAVRSIDWEPALRNANRFYNRLAAAMRVRDRTTREKLLNELDQELRTLKKNATDAGSLAAALLLGKDERGKRIGDILLSMMVPACRKVQHAADRGEQGQRNLHITFALVAYRRDNGNYPKQLAELAPKYLKEVPNDLFSGKALIYRPSEKGYLLYSVGVNGKDDGGQSFDDDPPGDDPRVRIPLPELKRKE